jgi:succinoglycan biosynthesis transport protein ExoP
MSDTPRELRLPREALTAQQERDSLASGLRVLRRRWLIVVGVVLACLGVAIANHERGVKSYSATASVAFKGETLSDAALQVTPTGSGEPQRDAATEVLIAHSPEVAEAVRKQLHLNAGAGELLDEVTVEAAPNADVLELDATTHDPHYSAQLADAFAEQYIDFKAKAELANIATAESQLQAQISALPAGSAQRALLQQSQDRLSELRAVAGGSANIIGRASPPTSPTGKSLKTVALIGVVIGLAVAFLIIFLLESLDRRLQSIEEFEREYRLPALAGVPQSAFRTRNATQRNELEPYRILRSALDFAAVTRRMDTLMVTSAVSGEGKTTVAVDLAHAIALTRRPIVLVELDLRRPTFVQHFNLEVRGGVTTALMGTHALAELLIRPFPELPNFAVLPSGPLPQNPSEMLGSSRLNDLLAELAAEEHTVIIDAPPLNPVADAQVLLNSAAIHATILVARAYRTKRDAVRRARAILDRHMVEPVGLVVTGLRDAGRYGYEAYGSTASPDPKGESLSPASEAEHRRLPI